MYAVTMKGHTMVKRYHDAKAMITEQPGKTCNLPEGIEVREIGKSWSGMGGEVRDLYNCVEQQMRTDEADLRRLTSVKKF